MYANTGLKAAFVPIVLAHVISPSPLLCRKLPTPQGPPGGSQSGGTGKGGREAAARDRGGWEVWNTDLQPSPGAPCRSFLQQPLTPEPPALSSDMFSMPPPAAFCHLGPQECLSCTSPQLLLSLFPSHSLPGEGWLLRVSRHHEEGISLSAYTKLPSLTAFFNPEKASGDPYQKAWS